MTIEVTNPTSGEVVQRYTAMDPDEANRRIEAPSNACTDWRKIASDERSFCLQEAAFMLEANKDRYVGLMALEMGKPVRDGHAEIEKCAWLCRYVADMAEEMLAPETIETDAHRSFVAFQPLGVILGVMPWNYPFWQVFRFAAPALMAGNAVLLKHASNVSGCSLAIEELMHQAGFSPTLFQSLLISSDQVQAVIDHAAVKAVTLTGSKPAGQSVAAHAGKRIKPTLLELGGSDPYLILADADLDLTAEACVAGRLLNSGQSCIAAKRFIVEKAVQEDSEQGVVEKMKAARTGDPFDENTDVGPLARSDLRDTLHRQVGMGIDRGARCLLGGSLPDGKGFYYPPTVLTDVRPDMPAFDEETFGPVASITTAADEQEAILLANDTLFGLGATVFIRDIEKGERIAAGPLEAGNCFVNAYVKSNPRLPFGGIKESGYGRELSHYGIKSFVNIKTVYVTKGENG